MRIPCYMTLPIMQRDCSGALLAAFGGTSALYVVAVVSALRASRRRSTDDQSHIKFVLVRTIALSVAATSEALLLVGTIYRRQQGVQLLDAANAQYTISLAVITVSNTSLTHVLAALGGRHACWRLLAAGSAGSSASQPAEVDAFSRAQCQAIFDDAFCKLVSSRPRLMLDFRPNAAPTPQVVLWRKWKQHQETLNLLAPVGALSAQAALLLALDWTAPPGSGPPEARRIANGAVHAFEALLLVTLLVLEAVVQQHRRLNRAEVLDPLLAHHVKDEESGPAVHGTGM